MMPRAPFTHCQNRVQRNALAKAAMAYVAGRFNGVSTKTRPTKTSEPTPAYVCPMITRMRRA